MSQSERDGKSNVEALYQELILDHYRRPRNSGRLEHPDANIKRKNPFCGDTIELHLSFDGDRVSEARFTGQGCAISQASASMMTHMLEGKTVAEVVKLTTSFTQLVSGGTGTEQADDVSLGELRAFAGVTRLPNRHLCALLPWGALTEALTHHG